eukprot:6184984-Pleurochrysis_carterae.AAC.3
MASVTEPIWFTLSSSALAAFSLTARAILVGLVTVKSSPTTCTFSPICATRLCQFSQSSCARHGGEASDSKRASNQ